MPFLVSAPQSALPRCQEPHEHGVYFARKAGYLSAWAWDLRPLAAVVIPAELESSRILEPSDSEEFLWAAFAPEHFRSAAV